MVCFIAEIPYLVPTELKLPDDVLEKFREAGVPDGYLVQVCIAPLEYVIEKEGRVDLENPEVHGLPIGAGVYFHYDRGIRLNEYFWDAFSAGFKKYLGNVKKGDPIKVRVVIHTILLVVDKNEKRRKERRI